MTDRIIPDFEQWAKNILDRDELQTALKDAFEKGYSAGYIDGTEQGHIAYWDKTYAEKDH